MHCRQLEEMRYCTKQGQSLISYSTIRSIYSGDNIFVATENILRSIKQTSMCQIPTVMEYYSQGWLHCALGYGASCCSAVQGEQMETLQVGESGFCSRCKQGEEELYVGCLYSSHSGVATITESRVMNGPAQGKTLTKFMVQWFWSYTVFSSPAYFNWIDNY